MSSSKNKIFETTSFLSKSNSSYIEEMYDKFCKDPNLVPNSWQQYFEGIDDGKAISVNVGSGLSDEQRETFWHHKDDIINQFVEVRADAITKNQDSITEYSLRFPRFKTFRSFEVGEKI